MPQAPPTFRPRGQPSRVEQKREADERRGSARKRGYSSRWDIASRLFLRAHPLCLGCEAAGRITAAVLTDHVIPHQGDKALFWDRTNWQPVCRYHHDVVKQQLEAMWRGGKLSAAALRLDSADAVRLTG